MPYCPNCKTEYTENDFCIHCGAVLHEKKLQCKAHSARGAVAVCVLCHRPLCSDCANKRDSRFFCNDHEKVEVEEDWALVFQSVDFFEAAIVRSKLEGYGISVSAQNEHSIAYLGFMDTPIGRTNLEHPVKFFVPFDQYLLASQLLAEDEKL